MKTKMDPEYKRLWVEALRSGKYKQTFLTYEHEDEEGNKCYCVIGVLGKVVAKKTKRRFCDMCNPLTLATMGVLPYKLYNRCINYNDAPFGKSRSFKWLASYIERYF